MIDPGSAMDTRISDLIRRRRDRLQQGQCFNHVDVVNLDKNGTTDVRASHAVSHKNSTEYNDYHPCCHQCSCLKSEEDGSRKVKSADTKEFPCCKNCECLNRQETQKDQPKTNMESPVINSSTVPRKPAENIKTIRSKRIDPQTTKQTENVSNKVRYYDRNNRFSKQYKPNIRIDKIQPNDIASKPINEEKTKEKKEELTKKRNHQAVERGEKAMEKELSQKSYKELMKQLPLLRKEEAPCYCAKEKPNKKEKLLKGDEILKEMELDRLYEARSFRPIAIPSTEDIQNKKDEGARIIIGGASRQLDSARRREYINGIISQLKLQQAKLQKEIVDLQSSRSNIESVKETKEKGTETLISVKENANANAKIIEKASKDKRKAKGVKTKTSKESEQQTEPIKSRDNEESAGKSKDSAESYASSTPASDDSIEEFKSPAKKLKKASERKTKTCTRNIIILQNTSTQTSPKGTIIEDKVDVETAVSEKQVCPETHVTCDCLQKVIEVDDNQCEILIKIKDIAEPEVIVIKSDEVDKVPIKDREGTAEKELSPRQVSKEDEVQEGEQSLRPKELFVEPLYLETQRLQKKCKSNSWRERLNSYSTTTTSYFSPPNAAKIVTKPSPKEVDPKLLDYIKKLLKTSRSCIDQLTVSSPSDVSTPSQSIIEMESNTNYKKIESLLKLMYMRKGHSSSSDSSVQSSLNNEQSREFVEYSSIERSFNRKIDDINAMIRRVREEKKKMIRSPYNSESSEKELSTTAHLEIKLPEKKKDNIEPQNEEKEHEDEKEKVERKKLTEQLLKVDLNYEECLKIGSPTKSSNEDDKDHSDEELYLRYKQLKSVNIEPQTSVWLDIPKLSTLEVPTTYNLKKHPPPSKGLISAKKFNENINSNPHELSTIAEADSAMTKIDEKEPKIHEGEDKKDAKGQSSSSLSSDLELTEEMLQDIGMNWAIPILRKTKQSLAASSSSSDSKDLSKGSFYGTRKASDLSKEKIPSSSFKSDAAGSHGGIFLDFDDISDIQTSSDKKELTKTSTPIQQQQGSGSKQGDIFENTDVSSVKTDKESS